MKLPLSIFRPIVIEEGTTMPRFYSCARYLPLRLSETQDSETHEWKQIAYPIPVSLVLAVWYRLVWFVLRDCRVLPQYYTSKVFRVMTHCPNCKAPFRDEFEMKLFGGSLVKKRTSISAEQTQELLAKFFDMLNNFPDDMDISDAEVQQNLIQSFVKTQQFRTI